MKPEYLPCVEIGQASDVDSSVIWLHGLGADGHDFEPIVPELGLNPGLAVRFVFPHAPQRAVTINSGVVMPAWYDIIAMDFLAQQDEAGIRQSEQHLQSLIAREHERGVPSERVILAGFSQGGAIALHTGLRYPHRLGGVMALSTYLPLDERVARERHQANQDIPIMMAHGTYDNVVPLRLAEMSRDYLQQLGYEVSWHEYPMEHSVMPAEIMDISQWLNTRFK